MIYIALLRGINVSGHKKILMTDLRELLHNKGLNNVQTYIQSGNVIFESDETSAVLSRKISTYIYKEYKFDVPVLVKTISEWEVALSNNPFLNDNSEIDIKKLYVTFLSDIPAKVNAKALLELDYSPDKFILQDNLIYSYFANGSGRSNMTINIFEKKLKVSATSRNWNTVNKLFELSSSKKHN